MNLDRPTGWIAFLGGLFEMGLQVYHAVRGDGGSFGMFVVGLGMAGLGLALIRAPIRR